MLIFTLDRTQSFFARTAVYKTQDLYLWVQLTQLLELSYSVNDMDTPQPYFDELQ